MTDDQTSLKSIASLRYLAPTLWYFIADSKRLIDPIRNLTFDGVTRPWAFLGACLTLYGIFHSFAHGKLVDPSVLPSGIDPRWSRGDTVDFWIMFFLPFCCFYWHTLSRKKPSPSYASIIAVFLYISGAQVFHLSINDLFVLLSHKPIGELPFFLAAIQILITFYLTLFRPALVLIEFERAETDSEIEAVWIHVSSAAGKAFLVFIALAVFTAHIIEWSPGRFLDQVLIEK